MIGFDIGGTKCAVTVGRETDGRLVVEENGKLTRLDSGEVSVKGKL